MKSSPLVLLVLLVVLEYPIIYRSLFSPKYGNEPGSPLALDVCFQGKYTEAEPLYERVIEIWKRHYGPEHPDVATALNNKAELLADQVSCACRVIISRRK